MSFLDVSIRMHKRNRSDLLVVWMKNYPRNISNLEDNSHFSLQVHILLPLVITLLRATLFLKFPISEHTLNHLLKNEVIQDKENWWMITKNISKKQVPIILREKINRLAIIRLKLEAKINYRQIQPLLAKLQQDLIFKIISKLHTLKLSIKIKSQLVKLLLNKSHFT